MTKQICNWCGKFKECELILANTEGYYAPICSECKSKKENSKVGIDKQKND